MCRIASFSGAESEESFKDFGKNREAMRLCREGECVFFSIGPKVYFGSGGLHTNTGAQLDSNTLKPSLGQHVKSTVYHAHHEFTGQPDITRETSLIRVAVEVYICVHLFNNLTVNNFDLLDLRIGPYITTTMWRCY